MALRTSYEDDTLYDEEDERPKYGSGLKQAALNSRVIKRQKGTGLSTKLDDDSVSSDTSPDTDELQQKKSDSAKDLRDQESGFGLSNSNDQSDDEEQQLFNNKDDEKSSRFPRVRSGLQKLSKRKGLAIALGAGGAGSVIGILMILVMLSSMKVLHFGQVVSTAGFIRLNSVMQERTTQILFDNAATVGEGNISLRGRSVLDKITFRNLDAQVTELGQQNKLKFILNEGELQGIRLPAENRTITLDGITKELGFGEKFTDISKGWSSKLNPRDYRRVAAVRSEFTKQLSVGIDEGLALESRAVRGRVNKIVADNIGFKFSRWRQKAREYTGLKPNEAAIKNTVDLADEVAGTDVIETGVDELDGSQKQVKNAARIEEFMKKNGGVFDKEKFFADVMAGEAKAGTIKNVASKVGVGVMIGSVACMANQAMSRVDEVAASNERQAEKQAALQMAARDQQLQGESVDEAIGAEASSLDGADESPWYQYTQYGEVRNDSSVNAPRIEPKYGNIANLIQAITSPTRIATAGVTGGVAPQIIPDSVLDRSDAAFCNALLSEEGLVVGVAAEVIVTAAASFFSGGGAAAVEQGGGRVLLTTLVRELATATFTTARGVFTKESLATLGGIALYQLGLEFAVRQLSATDFMGTEQGAEKIERTGVGSSLLQSRRLRAAGGAPLSSDEALEVDRPYMKQKQTSFNNKGVFARYFSIDNPYSMLGSMSASVSFNSGSPGTIVSNALSRASSFITSGGLFQPVLKPVLGSSSQAHAATNYNPYFDVVQWGYSKQELNLMRTDPSYSNLMNRNFISDQRITKLDSEYGECFNPELLQVEVQKLSQCSASELRKNDEMFRYRLTKLDDEVESRLSQSPSEIRQPSTGSDTGNTSDNSDTDTPSTTPTDSSTCAQGTKDLGTADTYIGGNLTPSKICAVIGFKSTSSESNPGSSYSVAGADGNVIVSASASSSFVNLFNAMSAAGLKPIANSSFRTMAHQQQLCRANSLCNSGTYTRVAKPGTSNHQGGNAIDFGNCSTRSTACYAWLNANAGKWGIKNYPEEAWHWSTTGR